MPRGAVRSSLGILSAGVAVVLASCRGEPVGDALPPVPDPEGFAGSFAGTSNGLVVAGGAHFPDRKPWDGGTKVWTDAVFYLDAPAGRWRRVGRLPRPLGYGVSAAWSGGVVCAGGSNAGGHFADVFRVTVSGEGSRVDPLPPLPITVANGCGAIVGHRLFVVGGQEAPASTEALATAFSLDLSSPDATWRREPPLPGPGRILATAAACGATLYVVGGASLAAGADGKAQRTYLADGYRFRPGAGWDRIADLPRPTVAAPSPAPADDRGFWLLGGDDGSHVNFDPPAAHPGFSPAVLRYDAAANTWTAAGTLPAPRVTVPVVRWADRWVIPGGEVRPGVRSPEVLSFRPPHGN
ncbi:kelch repeat-containing protein : Kelch repeat-containing protein OS=Pirellula staleyi (strain ATCC 27377 / DSM 6068 / ICPB 4128) GN=Psta_1238 PE=4 SV=1 [Gemmataceae bacterium]|nr:kelch repeat-containing protein : Kelch repeat-containing protein OS=Pirellula staleyi (strain ATCC 27377 / DSM 6068 / ICPB 4128) GN=Psta_1238 PE=4 SV=1 [Gemmataceae bacterium]VTT96491.1 kelch repeat-containing protein : Kelch repeat-containing protein OS=Pirellula staleyi (strain ATCC 27377 / DSM 6068 / ICPB 4128) GN=Psta_1238 PE=4 SV=1 [Gemmataceae bacterium]